MLNLLFLIKPEINFITNLHTSEQNGIHWSGGQKNIDGENYYFDPTKELLENGTYSTFQIQKPGTSYYGQLCICVLYKLQEETTLLDIMLKIKDDCQSSVFCNSFSEKNPFTSSLSKSLISYVVGKVLFILLISNISFVQ